jgi:hypothetical protein
VRAFQFKRRPDGGAARFDRDGGSTDKPEKDVAAPAMCTASPKLSVIVTPEGRLTAGIASVEIKLWSMPPRT